MTFSGELWDRGAALVYDEIVRHPFITGLTDGTLNHDAFRYFIIQDSHYLRNQPVFRAPAVSRTGQFVRFRERQLVLKV